MTSFSRQKPLKSKIQKHTIVGNAKFYYRAKFQLKRLKIKKLVWKRPLFDDSWPGVKVGERYMNVFFVIRLAFLQPPHDFNVWWRWDGKNTEESNV